MSEFRKKPIVIEATQWFKNGDHPLDGVGMEAPDGNGGVYQRVEGLVVRFFRRPDVSGEASCQHCTLTMHVHGWINTLEGGHIVCPGDWVITGVKGERYPCKPDIFEQTYQPAQPHQQADTDPGLILPAPAPSYWRCFFCNFSTDLETVAAAHFGDRDDPEECKPICKWWALMQQDERIGQLQDLVQQRNYEQMENFNLDKQVSSLLSELGAAKRLRPRSEYHEDFGPVLWHHLPISEPPYIGSPLDTAWDDSMDAYYTHWQVILQSGTDGSELLTKPATEPA